MCAFMIIIYMYMYTDHVLYSKLSNEQDYHINSRHEVQRLSNELQKLEEELHYAQEDKRKVSAR